MPVMKRLVSQRLQDTWRLLECAGEPRIDFVSLTDAVAVRVVRGGLPVRATSETLTP